MISQRIFGVKIIIIVYLINTTMILKNTLRNICCIVGLVISISGCAMDFAGTIDITNKSDNKMYTLINDNYPDTTLSNAYVSTLIKPNSSGFVAVRNKEWHEYLAEKDTVTIIFAEYKPPEFYESEKKKSQKVYGRLILTQSKLDSLGGKIVFPDDVR